MGLIRCEDCGASVSDRAKACPQCGGPMSSAVAPAASSPEAAVPASGSSSLGLLLLGPIILAAIVGVVYLVYRPDPGRDAELQAAVTQNFVDPASAQFRNIRWLSETAACGEVNGANRFGGKVGFEPFYATRPGGTGQFEVFLSGNTQVETSLVASACGAEQ